MERDLKVVYIINENSSQQIFFFVETIIDKYLLFFLSSAKAAGYAELEGAKRHRAAAIAVRLFIYTLRDRTAVTMPLLVEISTALSYSAQRNSLLVVSKATPGATSEYAILSCTSVLRSVASREKLKLYKGPRVSHSLKLGAPPTESSDRRSIRL